jgi:hypothetical protein
MCAPWVVMPWGVSGMNLKDGSTLVDITSSMDGDKLLVLSELGYGKISYAKDTDLKLDDGTNRHYDGYRLTSRGAKGVISLKSSSKNGHLTAMRAVHGDEDLMVITTKGIVIRTPLDQVKIAGRNTQGVKIIALDPGQKVASLTILPHIDEAAEEAAEAERAKALEEDAANMNAALKAEEPEEPTKKHTKASDDADNDDNSSSDGASGSGSDDDI